jgi:hypothetical protein
MPQSKQTINSGKTHTMGLSMLFSPGEWMPISPLILLWLTDPQDLQANNHLNWESGTLIGTSAPN